MNDSIRFMPVVCAPHVSIHVNRCMIFSVNKCVSVKKRS